MFEVVISSSSKSVDREIDEYHDSTSDSGSSSHSSSKSNNNSCGGNTMDKQYTSGVLGLPLEVLQE